MNKISIIFELMLNFRSVSVILSVVLFSVSCNIGSDEPEITFNRDIAPVIFKNCTPCHRKGEAGPFELLTYRDVRNKAKTILKVVQSGLMPPWPSDTSYQRFVGERYLSEHEKQMIYKWAELGFPEGNNSDLPDPPHFPSGSSLGDPDLVITLDNVVEIPGDNRDRFLVIKIPFELDRDTFLRMAEYVPGNRQLSHHVNGHIVQYNSHEKKDVFDGPRIIDREYAGTLDSCYRYLKLLNDDGSYPLLTPSVFNYLPGVIPQKYPESIGGYILRKKGAILLRDIHYGPTPVKQTDMPRVNLFFGSKPPARPFLETQLGTLGISEIIPPLLIPPDTVMKFVTKAKIHNDISLVTINPHMHLLGKSFLAYALTATGDTIPLIRINKWDFRWQYFYTYRKMLKIPAGSVIVAEGVFDNTSSNPNNPFFPPQEITGLKGSMKTTDEMFQLIMTFLPYEPGDENISLDENVKNMPGLN